MAAWLRACFFGEIRGLCTGILIVRIFSHGDGIWIKAAKPPVELSALQVAKPGEALKKSVHR